MYACGTTTPTPAMSANLTIMLLALQTATETIMHMNFIMTNKQLLYRQRCLNSCRVVAAQAGSRVKSVDMDNPGGIACHIDSN